MTMDTKYYFTGKECKRGHTAKRLSVNGDCVSCVKERSAKWYRKNKEITKQRAADSGNNSHYKNWGICVYKVIYPNGLYIGSGYIQSRRQRHLKAGALEFIPLAIGTTDECRWLEAKLILFYGLDNLLNKKHGDCDGK